MIVRTRRLGYGMSDPREVDFFESIEDTTLPPIWERNSRSYTGSLMSPAAYRGGNTSDLGGFYEMIQNFHPGCTPYTEAALNELDKVYATIYNKRRSGEQFTPREMNMMEQALQDMTQYQVGVLDCLTHHLQDGW